MKDLIIDQIERRARLDHGGDFSKAVTEYFWDRPEEWRRHYRDKDNGLHKRVDEDRRLGDASAMVSRAPSIHQPWLALLFASHGRKLRAS